MTVFVVPKHADSTKTQNLVQSIDFIQYRAQIRLRVECCSQQEMPSWLLDAASQKVCGDSDSLLFVNSLLVLLGNEFMKSNKWIPTPTPNTLVEKLPSGQPQGDEEQLAHSKKSQPARR